MDDVENGFLQGTLAGRLLLGGSLVPGLFGQALHTDGSKQRVEFPIDGSNECLQNPDSCSSGVTFSIWIMSLGWNNGRMSAIYHSDGCNPRGFGFCFGLDSDFWVTVRGSPLAYRYRIPPLLLNRWQHVVISFRPNDGIIVYVDGCDSFAYRITTGYEAVSANFPTLSFGTTFRLGAGGTAYSANVKLDHILVWYDSFNSDEIWKLYLQEGMI